MNVLILGASARSAAFSALRIGLRPTCADLFGDADLIRSCPSARVDPSDYPDALASFADTLPATPWLYTGAIENRPDLVDRISARHPLLGNVGSELRSVRDPFKLAEAFREDGLAATEVREGPTGLPYDGSWLVKPIASGGGRGIRPLVGVPPTPGRAVYYQQRIEGLPLAALFVADGRSSRLLGITRQFVGRPGRRFAYRGSLGPWPVSDDVGGQIDRLGRAVASRFALRGIFGLDLVLGGGRAWPIEVNPRYTASVEVLEWALGRSLLAEHVRAFGHEAPIPSTKPEPQEFVGKAILFSESPISWASGRDEAIVGPDRFPEIADIPQVGTRFQAGDPVVTVFARGRSIEECRRNLATQARRWRRRLRVLSA